MHRSNLTVSGGRAGRYFPLLFGLLLLLEDRGAAAPVGGTPPPAGCGRTLVFSKSVGGPQLLTGGGLMDVQTTVFLDLTQFPPGPPCATAVLLEIDLTLDCTPGPDASTSAFFVPAEGFSNYTVPLPIPSGSAREGVLSGTATVTFSDATTLVSAPGGDVEICIVDPAPGNPSVPRLDLQLLTPPVAHAHPGDEAPIRFRLMNNDPADSFSGILTIDMRNRSRMPSVSGGGGEFSINDPQLGHNFPIDFGDLMPGICVPLPLQPLDPATPHLTRPVTLAPGASQIVEIRTRSWGMCANGSCGESNAQVEGTFSDASAGKACASADLAVDTAQAPQFRCLDGGRAALFDLPVSGPPGRLLMRAMPAPSGPPYEIEIELVQLQLQAGGPVIPLQTQQSSGLLTPDYGRTMSLIRNQLPAPLFPVDSFFDVFYQVTLDGGPATPTVPIEIVSMGLVGGGPTGFTDAAPMGIGLLKANGPQPAFPVDSFFDVFYQVSGFGTDDANDTIPIEIVPLSLTSIPTGISGHLRCHIGPAPGTGTQIVEIRLMQDFRGFARAIPLPSSTGNWMLYP